MYIIIDSKSVICHPPSGSQCSIVRTSKAAAEAVKEDALSGI